MSDRPSRFPNPFYALLLVVSTAFVVTIFAYLIAPTVIDQGSAEGDDRGTLAVAAWLNRHSPTVLAAEIAVMLLAAVLAMATDHLFAPPPEKPTGGGSP